ncbi:MAG: glycosyltransferase, partial [Planctomycetaceae bacterium]|nr:glycosyltransferase [Planctomycetaceae bacterium]
MNTDMQNDMIKKTTPYSEEWLTELQQLLGKSTCDQLGLYAIPSTLLLSVVVPVYNEKETLHLILEKIRSVPINKEIILVDDCSKDGTTDLLKQMEQDQANA